MYNNEIICINIDSLENLMLLDSLSATVCRGNLVKVTTKCLNKLMICPV